MIPNCAMWVAHSHCALHSLIFQVDEPKKIEIIKLLITIDSKRKKIERVECKQIKENTLTPILHHQHTIQSNVKNETMFLSD